MVNIHTGVRFFGKIGPFSNFQFQEKIMSKLPHIAYRKKNYYSSSTICKKSHVNIFKITHTGRSQKRIIKKKHPVYICSCEIWKCKKKYLKYNNSFIFGLTNNFQEKVE